PDPVPRTDEVAAIDLVIQRLPKEGAVPISVDARAAEVARAALDAGAAVINDVSGLRFDPELANVARAADAGVILMHMRGTPATMDDLAKYEHVAAEVSTELAAMAAKATERGIAPER